MFKHFKSIQGSRGSPARSASTARGCRPRLPPRPSQPRRVAMTTAPRSSGRRVRAPRKGRRSGRALAPLVDALEKALDLLRLCRDGSRIFMVRRSSFAWHNETLNVWSYAAAASACGRRATAVPPAGLRLLSFLVDPWLPCARSTLDNLHGQSSWNCRSAIMARICPHQQHSNALDLFRSAWPNSCD